jgi:hypothetical protein
LYRWDLRFASDLWPFLELSTITALAAVGTAAALMHGDVLFGVLFGAATGFAATNLIQRFLNI